MFKQSTQKSSLWPVRPVWATNKFVIFNKLTSCEYEYYNQCTHSNIVEPYRATSNCSNNLCIFRKFKHCGRPSPNPQRLVHRRRFLCGVPSDPWDSFVVVVLLPMSVGSVLMFMLFRNCHNPGLIWFVGLAKTRGCSRSGAGHCFLKTRQSSSSTGSCSHSTARHRSCSEQDIARVY